MRVAYRAHRLVLDPDGFFDAESESPRLWIPAVIVLLIGVARMAQGLYVNGYTTSAMEASGNAAGGGGGMRVLFTVPSLLIPFVSWLLIGAILVAVCAYLGGEGDGTDTLAVAGWGFVPALAGALMTLGVTLYILGGTDPSGIQEAVEVQGTLFETLRSTSVRALRYVLVGWQAFIWSFGISHVHGLELRKAALPAVTAGGVVVAWDLFGSAVITGIMGVFL
jgi:hypothetical protein